jgi:hypothetical protein
MVAELSKSRTAFTWADAGAMGLNPTQGMDV